MRAEERPALLTMVAPLDHAPTTPRGGSSGFGRLGVCDAPGVGMLRPVSRLATGGFETRPDSPQEALMGIMENVKNAVRGRSDKVADAVDTAVDKVDQRTKGKYRDKLDSGAGKVKETVTKLDPEAERTAKTEGRTAAGETSWDPTDTGRSDRGPVTGTPPPTGPDASTGTGPDPVAQSPASEPTSPTTSGPGNENRGGTGPLQ